MALLTARQDSRADMREQSIENKQTPYEMRLNNYILFTEKLVWGNIWFVWHSLSPDTQGDNQYLERGKGAFNVAKAQNYWPEAD